MLVQTVKTPVRCSQKIEKRKFRIEESPHAFSILSQSLYSDKIKSVIRELSTNAVDAHRFVGTDKPFVVHLPNTLEPFFSIRDYGPGLSEEEVYSLYTTYFSSGHNKIASNDYNGYFGLGSKSFFAYTNIASLTSFYDGIETNYTLVIENGYPKVLKLPNQIVTSEPSGLMIKFAVSNDDRYEFLTAAQDLYQYFQLKPTVVGNSSFAIKDVEYV